MCDVFVRICDMCMKVEVTPLVTLFRPRGHTLFRRMQTPRLMDDRSGYFPGFSFTREIVIHPLGEPEGRPGPLLYSAFIFSWIQDAMKRLRAQPLWLSFTERRSKSSATAVPTPNSLEMYCAENISRIWHKQKHSFFFAPFHTRYLHDVFPYGGCDGRITHLLTSHWGWVCYYW